MKKPKSMEQALRIAGFEDLSPLIGSLKNVKEDPRFHGEETTFNHVNLFFENLPPYCEPWLLYAGLFHDLGKLNTRYPFFGHEEKSCEYLQRFPNSLECQNEKMMWVVRNHGRMLDGSFREIISHPYFPDLLIFHMFDSLSMVPPRLNSFYSIRALQNQSPPNSVAVQLTDRCNLRCSHCYSVPEKPSDLTPDTLSIIAKDLKSAGLDKIVLFGGEPFLSEHLYDIISICTKYLLVPDLVTNGTLVDSEALVRARDSGLTRLTFSVDGMKEEHAKIRGADNFESVIEAIITAKELGYHIRVNTSAMRSNISSIPSLINLLSSVADLHKIIYTTPFGRCQKEQWIPPDEWLAFHREIKSMGVPTVAVENPYVASQHDFCHLNEPVVLADGSVFPCIMLINSIKPLGNVNYSSFSAIWNEKKQATFNECIGYKQIGVDTKYGIVRCPLRSG